MKWPNDWFDWVQQGGGTNLEWRFESADQIYPSAMRSELMAILHDHGTSDSDFAAAELIYGELISNLIRHARGKVTVTLDWPDEYPTLSVHEEQCYVRPSISLPNDVFAESGRGLYIVKSLARDFTSVDEGSAGSATRATLPVKRRLNESR